MSQISRATASPAIDELPAAPSLDRVRKELEDRLWYLDGTRYVRAFRTPPSQFEDEDWD